MVMTSMRAKASEKLKIVSSRRRAQISPMVQYRSNVAALVVDPSGSLLICERVNVPGAWQFPQGGVDPGESLEQALFREVREEVGLEAEHYSGVRPRNDVGWSCVWRR